MTTVESPFDSIDNRQSPHITDENPIPEDIWNAFSREYGGYNYRDGHFRYFFDRVLFDSIN
jgi:hypothetical protein